MVLIYYVLVQCHFILGVGKWADVMLLQAAGLFAVIMSLLDAINSVFSTDILPGLLHRFLACFKQITVL